MNLSHARSPAVPEPLYVRIPEEGPPSIRVLEHSAYEMAEVYSSCSPAEVAQWLAERTSIEIAAPAGTGFEIVLPNGVRLKEASRAFHLWIDTRLQECAT